MILERERGSVLILSLVMILSIGGMSASLLLLNMVYSRGSAEDFDQEIARAAAESGLAYYFIEATLDRDYFDTATFKVPSPLANGSFTLVDAVPGPSAGQWELTILGESGRGAYRLKAMFGRSSVEFPDGVVVGGTGNDSDVIFSMSSWGAVGSFDPADGNFDPDFPGESGNIAANGSLGLNNKAMIHGNVNASGTLQTGQASSVTGDLVENGARTPVADIDPIVLEEFNSSQASNDNGVLSSIFDTLWFPMGGPENYGNLVVDDGGTYVVPAGTYRLRQFEVLNHSSVVFDTSKGPVTLVYVGAGKATGTGNDLTLANYGSVLIDSQGTANGLLTVLGPDTDFKVRDHSVYGQNTDGSDSAGYSQLISLGGNTSSDDILVENGASVYARVYAASHSFQIGDQAAWFGSVMARTVSIANQAILAVDEGSLGNSLEDPTSFVILGKWRSH